MVPNSLQDGVPKQLTLHGQKARDVMERVSLMQFARVKLRETAALPPHLAFGSLTLQKTSIWGPVNDRILLQVIPFPPSLSHPILGIAVHDP